METKRILFVDDDSILHFIIQEQLTELGLKVQLNCVKNGFEALDHLNALRVSHPDEFPNILLIDQSMPKMGGWELIECMAESMKREIAESSVYLFSGDISLDRTKLDPQSRYHGIPVQLVEKPLTHKALIKMVGTES